MLKSNDSISKLRLVEEHNISFIDEHSLTEHAALEVQTWSTLWVSSPHCFEPNKWLIMLHHLEQVAKLGLISLFDELIL